LIEAYETLADPERRAEYNRRIRRAAAAARAAKSEAAATDSQSTDKRREKAAGHDKSSNSRRVFERMGRRAPVYYGPDKNPSAAGEMIDFSPDGMLMICQERLALNSTIHISSKLLHAVARVSRCRAAATPGQFSIGLKFLSVSFESASGTFVSTLA